MCANHQGKIRRHEVVAISPLDKDLNLSIKPVLYCEAVCKQPPEGGCGDRQQLEDTGKGRTRSAALTSRHITLVFKVSDGIGFSYSRKLLLNHCRG